MPLLLSMNRSDVFMLLQQVSFTLSRLCLEDGAIVRLHDWITAADADEAERMEMGKTWHLSRSMKRNRLRFSRQRYWHLVFIIDSISCLEIDNDWNGNASTGATSNGFIVRIIITSYEGKRQEKKDILVQRTKKTRVIPISFGSLKHFLKSQPYNKKVIIRYRDI